MIGHYLLSLTPEQEDRILTTKMGNPISVVRPREPAEGCILQVANGFPEAGWHDELCYSDRHNLFVKMVGHRYDRLRSRFSDQRLNAAIRNRILSNRARRSLVGKLQGEVCPS